MDLLMKIYTVADGRHFGSPTGALFRYFRGRRHFQNTIGHTFAGKSRPSDHISPFHRARCQSKNALPPTQSV